MNCPRCSSPIPPGAAFCMHCGQPLVQGPGGQAAPAPIGKGWWIAAGVALAIVALFVGLGASGALGKWGIFGGDALRAEGSQSSGNALQAEGQLPPGGALQAQGAQGGDALRRPGEKIVMPDDVRRWLEHLERIEKRREELSMDQMAQAIGLMTELQLGGTLEQLQSILNDPTDEGQALEQTPAKRAETDLDAMRKAWNDLNREFHSVRAPAECVPLQNRYDTVITETGGMMLDMLDALSSSSTERDKALSTLMKMKGTSSDRIGKPAIESDDMVAGICDKYDTRKWFKISADFGGGMLQKLSF